MSGCCEPQKNQESQICSSEEYEKITKASKIENASWEMIVYSSMWYKSKSKKRGEKKRHERATVGCKIPTGQTSQELLFSLTEGGV